MCSSILTTAQSGLTADEIDEAGYSHTAKLFSSTPPGLGTQLLCLKKCNTDVTGFYHTYIITHYFSYDNFYANIPSCLIDKLNLFVALFVVVEPYIFHIFVNNVVCRYVIQ